MIIQDNWKIKSFEIGEVRDLEIANPEYIDHYWMSAKVPGDVHSTLIEKKIIEDPFIGHNDLKCEWIEKKVWWYRTEFHFDKNVTDGERLELTFDGLDTFATIYINGIEIGSTNNMFIEHTFDVIREIINGKNIMAIKFDPVSVHTKEKQIDFWSGFNKERIWTRKAQMNFGWDWGPKLVTVGIWKPVRLERKQYAKIESVYANTIKIQDNNAFVDVEVELDIFRKGHSFDVEVSLSIDGVSFHKEAKVEGNKAIYQFKVENPKLWWTHDLGEPHLYALEVTLKNQEQTIDKYKQNIGIRTIEVLQKDERGENLFTFVLNGVKIFAKGANWIPIDSFIGAAPDERYEELIRLSRESHMNMLRVWGGGIYEKEVFYEECDRQGLLVWQDFMFACALYPDFNRNFMENVRQEIIKVVKRLRNYPSIAIWCGNNENDWLYEVQVANGEISTPFYGEKIYHELIPSILEELDTSRLYWPSSPFGGNDHDSEDVGDRHNWQVWHGNQEPRKFGEVLKTDYSIEGVSFKNYKKDKTRFSSEFGMHASANRYTLECNMPEGTFYWKSDEMSYRNKDYHHQKGILLMEGFTGIPQNLEEYMNFSMLTQAEGLKYGIEHYRRRKPYTSGALVWQLNDCWPGTSWAMIDYYLLPKASYYYAKKFYHPVLVSLDHDAGEDVKVWVTNDQLQGIQDKVKLEVFDFEGTVIFEKEFEVNIDANSTVQVGSCTEEEVLNGANASEVFIRLSTQKSSIQENTYYLRDYKDMSLPKVELTVDLDEENQEITITANKLARFVIIEIPGKKIIMSDNFFDLLPGQQKTIQVKHLEGSFISFKDLKVSAINN